MPNQPAFGSDPASETSKSLYSADVATNIASATPSQSAPSGLSVASDPRGIVAT